MTRPDPITEIYDAIEKTWRPRRPTKPATWTLDGDGLIHVTDSVMTAVMDWDTFEKMRVEAGNPVTDEEFAAHGVRRA